MKICYIEKRFNASSRTVLEQANAIMVEYVAQGYDLTLRQLYYQMVARGFIENSLKSYKRVGNIISEGRLAGLLDWNVMVDRTRPVREVQHWDSPRELVEAAANSYHIDTRAGQDEYVEVFCEKEALAGIIVPVCRTWDVPCLICRGYVSQSAMHEAALRIKADGRPATILYLGDHDPSGLDMPRDVNTRLNITFQLMEMPGVQIDRLALTMEQINELEPPPNPAKETDARWAEYVAHHGEQSWEMDAIDPRRLETILVSGIKDHTNIKAQKLLQAEQQKGAQAIMRAARSMD